MAASRKVRVREKRDERQRGPQREESWWPERRLVELADCPWLEKGEKRGRDANG
ncbi:hypothetical protein HAX54_015330, partial [Datura stramonium]|nr:hypothetical protein [Datura stramonium]